MKALILVCAAGLLALGGCVSTREPASLADITALPFGAVDPAAPQGHAPRPSASGEANILVMSSGGADGAFGVGVLDGWTASGKRPRFDVVTGVSTGAMAATDAFLGSDYDTRLRAALARMRNRDVYTSRGPLSALFNDSLYDTAPLARTLAGLIDQPVLDAVAAEHAKGRRLYVAATNLDAGRLVVWDMGAIASSSRPDRLELYRKVILASSAVPASFNPVYLKADGASGAQMLVDGGVHEPLLLKEFMIEPFGKGAHVWVILNVRLKPFAGGSPVKPRVTAIAIRASLEVYRALAGQMLYQAYAMTQGAGDEFNLVQVPDDIATVEEGVQFRPEQMQRLYQRGVEVGRSGAWSHEPEGLDGFLRRHRH